MTATADTALDPDLVSRVKSLSSELKAALFEIAWEDGDGPPEGPDWPEIQRRIDDVNAGRAILLSREESDAMIKARIRELGLEL